MEGSSDHVVVEVKLATKDIKAFAATLNRRWRRSLGTRRVVVGLLLVTTMAIGLALIETDWALALFVVSVVGIEFWKRSARARRIEEVRADHEAHIVADRDGLVVQTSSMTVSASWSSFREIVCADDHIFLILTSMGGYIVPKRCFADADQMSRFLAFVQAARQPWGPPADLAS